MKKRKIYNEKVDIPDIVNDKCNMAYEQIRNQTIAKKTVKKIHHKKKAVIGIVVAAAVLGCTVPVAANYFKNAFDVVYYEVYTKNPAQQMNVAEYATDVNIEARQLCADITMQSVYCDGNNIALAFALNPITEDLQNATAINAWVSIKLDGKIVNDITYDNFSLSEDGMFYMTSYCTDLEIKDNAKLDVKIYALKGINGNYMKWVPNDSDNYYAAGTYVPKETEVFEDVFEFTDTVNPNRSNNKLYEVNETNNGITLKSVLVTPFKTDVNIDCADNTSVRVTDDSGNELECMLNHSEWNGWSFESPLKTANKLNIEVLDIYQDGFPVISSFTVDIEKGFAEKYTIKFNDSDTVYDPPLEELQAHQEQFVKDSFLEAVNTVAPLPVGSTYALYGHYISEDFPKLAVKITGSEIGSFSDYNEDKFSIWDTPKGCENMSEEELKNYVLNDDNFKLMLVSYEISNNSFGDDKFYFSGMEIMSKNHEYCFSEPYISVNKENGGVEGYYYNIEAKSTKTLTFGYVIPKDMDIDDFYGFKIADNSSCEYVYPGEQVLHGEANFYALN